MYQVLHINLTCSPYVYGTLHMHVTALVGCIYISSITQTGLVGFHQLKPD
jgi:hypothetical protein